MSCGGEASGEPSTPVPLLVQDDCFYRTGEFGLFFFSFFYPSFQPQDTAKTFLSVETELFAKETIG